MANPENLVPNSMRSPSEVRANAAKGGRKSGETRRRRKTFKELMEIAFERKTMAVVRRSCAVPSGYPGHPSLLTDPFPHRS